MDAQAEEAYRAPKTSKQNPAITHYIRDAQRTQQPRVVVHTFNHRRQAKQKQANFFEFKVILAK